MQIESVSKRCTRLRSHDRLLQTSTNSGSAILAYDLLLLFFFGCAGVPVNRYEKLIPLDLKKFFPHLF